MSRRTSSTFRTRLKSSPFIRNIGYGEVDVSSVYLNGVAIDSWKADNRVNVVAKFLIEEIKTREGLMIGDYNNLKLVGLTVDDESF